MSITDTMNSVGPLLDKAMRRAAMLPKRETIARYSTMVQPVKPSVVYSDGFRDEVIAYIEAGHSQAGTAMHFKIARSTIYKWCAPLGIKFKNGNFKHTRMAES